MKKIKKFKKLKLINRKIRNFFTGSRVEVLINKFNDDMKILNKKIKCINVKMFQKI